MYQKNVQLEMKEQESKEEKGGVLFIKDSIKNMKKKSEKQALWGNILFVVMMVMAIFLPVSVHAEENTSETLIAGQETTFTYPAGNFSLEYVFTPEEDGVYDIQMALPNGEYDVSYSLMSGENHLGGTDRNSIYNREESTDYFLFATHPMIKGTPYRIQLNATAVSAESGTGKILIRENSEAELQKIDYDGQENMTRNGYYYFTAPSDGKYQIEVSTKQETVEADEWGRVSVYYGTEGKNVFTEFYQNQTVRTPGFELTAGENAIIELYYNTDKDFEGTIKVTDYFDNQLQAYVSGTQETEKNVYVPDGGTAILSVDVQAENTSGISYQWYKLVENSSDEPIEEATSNTFVIENSPCELDCRVKDTYGNEVSVRFSVLGLSGELTINESEQLNFGDAYNKVLYKFTAEKADYYTIYTTPADEYIGANIIFYDSETLKNKISVSDYDEGNSFKGDIYLNKGQTIFILADGHSQGEMELCIDSSTEMGYVVIDENTFPDVVFRNCIKDEFIDWGENGLLSPEEIESVTSLYIQGSGSELKISSLKGVEIFKNLQSLNCRDNLLTELDLSGNVALKYLDCSNNKLTYLDVSKNVNLETLYCSGNQLTSLDISLNKKITTNFSCYDNQKEVMVSELNTYDLSSLPGSFDVNKASNWNGGTVNGNILTFTDKEVRYSYDLGNDSREIFTLIATNYNGESEGPGEEEPPIPTIPDPEPSNPDEEEPKPAVPDEKNPEIVKPAVPQNPTSSGAGEPSDRGQLTTGMTVTDTKTKSAYTVSGSTAGGYTVTYVCPSAKNVKNVTIPSTVTVNGVSCKVTSIAANAFKGQKKLKKVTIGGNVTSIGKKAFFGCKSLKKIVIKSKKLKKVQAKAFAKINQKAKIKVPKNKKKAYSKVFKKNTGISKKMF